MFHKLRSKGHPPLTHIRRPKQSCPPDAAHNNDTQSMPQRATVQHNPYITDKTQIDQTIINEWQHIRKGKPGDRAKLVQDFLRKYDPHIFKSDEFHIPELDVQSFKNQCRHAGASAASLDDWRSEEFALFSDGIYARTVQYLRKVENQGRWPSSLAMAKAVFLYKEDPATAGPLDLRILLILPNLYRRWIGTRLQDL